MSINSSLDKQIVAYPLNGFLLRNKRNESLIHATTRILKIITLNERSLMFSSKKEYTLYVNTLQNANKCTARSWGLGERWRGAGGRDMVLHRNTRKLWAHDLDYGDYFTSIHMSKNVSNCIF